MPSDRVYRLSDLRKAFDAEHLQAANRAVADSRAMLKNNPKPDTFAGRKTQEPFPQIDEEMIRWVGSRELQPPD